MRDFIKSAKFKILLAFIAFLTGIMIYSITRGGYSVGGESFINTITKPLRYVSNSLAVKVENTADKIYNAEEYYNENKYLKEQINDLKKQLADYDNLKAEVEQLRKFAVIKEEHPDDEFSVPAEVLGYTVNDPFRSFTIDRGSDDGIEPYCPVITADGLVGITIEVSAEVSVVRTILSPDLSVSAVGADSNAEYGVIEGTVLTAEDGNTKMTHLSVDNKLEEGDLILTAGNSGLFPKGYSIGTVKSKGFEKNGLSACAEIEPCCDIARLSDVVVITNFRGKQGQEEETTENTEGTSEE